MNIKINEYVTDHFKYDECKCPCCDRVKIIPVFFRHMELLEQMRVKLVFPIMINSGYRCLDHNKAIGGATRSWHLLFATDVRPAWVSGKDEEEVERRLKAMNEEGEALGFGGLGTYNTFMHLDLRPEKTRWFG